MTTFVAGQRVTALTLDSYAHQLLYSTTLAQSQSFVYMPVPTTYSRLMVNWRARSDRAGSATDNMSVFLNDDSAGNYLWQLSEGNDTVLTDANSGAAVSAVKGPTIPAATATASYFGSGSFTIDGANNTNGFKAIQGFGCGFATTTNTFCAVHSGQWLSTAAVSIVCLTPFVAVNFVAGSSFSVYGLK